MKTTIEAMDVVWVIGLLLAVLWLRIGNVSLLAEDEKGRRRVMLAKKILLIMSILCFAGLFGVFTIGGDISQCAINNPEDAPINICPIFVDNNLKNPAIWTLLSVCTDMGMHLQDEYDCTDIMIEEQGDNTFYLCLMPQNAIAVTVVGDSAQVVALFFMYDNDFDNYVSWVTRCFCTIDYGLHKDGVIHVYRCGGVKNGLLMGADSKQGIVIFTLNGE